MPIVTIDGIQYNLQGPNDVPSSGNRIGPAPGIPVGQINQDPSTFSSILPEGATFDRTANANFGKIAVPTSATSSVQQPIDARFQNLVQQAGQQVASPTVPAAGVHQPIQIEEITAGELQTPPLITAPEAVTAPTIEPTQFTAPLPTVADPAQVAGATVREVAPTAPVTQAVLGQINVEDLIDDVQGPLSSAALAQAQTEALDEKATVQFQLGELYKSLDDGTQLPAWAAPAARNVDQFMLQRGLGASSMAAAARTQALFESALPIAAADADKYSAIQLQNLNNKQTAALQNASEIAAMDRANLDVRMRSAQQNAASFLQMNIANVTNDQATNNINHQARMQELFSDVSSLNAARNFNATSQNQVNQFYETLGTTVEQNNVNRLAAQEQFNVDETNAMNQFNTSVNDLRDRTYEHSQQNINQSNALWRRTINTANTAVQNDTQRANAQALLGISLDSQNRMWQQYRDEANFLMNVSENNSARAHNAAMLSTQMNATINAYNESVKASFWTGLGDAIFSAIP